MIDTDARYQVKGWPGVAVYARGYEKRWEPLMVLYTDDEGNEWGEPDECGEGEWVEDTEGMVEVVMVGDDAVHKVDESDLTVIDDLDYCSGCGQIGCRADGRDRS